MGKLIFDITGDSSMTTEELFKMVRDVSEMSDISPDQGDNVNFGNITQPIRDQQMVTQALIDGSETWKSKTGHEIKTTKAGLIRAMKNIKREKLLDVIDDVYLSSGKFNKAYVEFVENYYN